MICAYTNCKNEVVGRAETAIYCSDDCKYAHHRRKEQERVRQGERKKQTSNGDLLLDTWISTPLSNHKSRRLDAWV